MKKILLILFVLVGYLGNSQTLIPGYTDINHRYNWRAGFFRALNIPAGDSAQLQTGQTARSGGIYLDTLHTITSPAGLYLYIEGVWVLQGGAATFNEPDALLYGGSVTYSGTGLVFNVQESIVRLCGNIYGFDSLQITLPAADPDFDKFYKIYLDSTGVQVLEGTPATPAQIPQIELCEWSLTDVLVRAAELVPDIPRIIIWGDNLSGEGIVTNVNTTTDANNTTNLYSGTKSINVTNINNTDRVFITTDGITPVQWNFAGKSTINGNIKLKAAMPTAANIAISVGNGSGTSFTSASSEVVISLNKNSLNYQSFAISVSALNITNYSVNRIRFRYLRPGNSTNYTGFYLDYVTLDSGIVITNPGQAVTSVGISVTGNALVEGNTPITSNGVFTLNWGGNSGQYINGLGNLVTFPTLLSTVGTIDGRSKNADGATIDGTELFMQLADDTYPGLLSPEHFIELMRDDSITNGTGGDTLLVYVNDSLLKIKSLIAGTNMAFVVTGDNITLNATGGGGARFGFPSEDDAAGEFRSFDAGVNDFHIEADGGGELRFTNRNGSDSNYIKFQNDGVLKLFSENSGLTSFIEMNGGAMAFHSDAFYFVENLADLSFNPGLKAMVWDSTDNRWGSIPTTLLGGGGGTGSNLSYDAANHEVDIDGGGTSAIIPLSLADGATEGLASFTAVDFDLTAGNVAIDYTNGQASSGSTKGFLTSADWTTFNGKQSVLTNSAGLAAALSDEDGSGLVQFQTTANPAHITITPSGSGISPSTMQAIVDADFTLTDATGVQTAFPAGMDVWTLQGSTTYHFKGQYNMTGGTASKTIGMAFLLGGGASVHSIGYTAHAANSIANTLATSNTITYINQVSVTVLTVAATTAGNQIDFEGYIKMNAGGTVTPQISYGTNAPAGATLMKTNSFIRFTPVGSHTFTIIGNVN